jgi:hypothetical protein
VLEDVLDLGSEIKGQRRERVMRRPCDPQRMGWSVQEVGIAEGDVLGT